MGEGQDEGEREGEGEGQVCGGKVWGGASLVSNPVCRCHFICHLLGCIKELAQTTRGAGLYKERLPITNMTYLKFQLY